MHINLPGQFPVGDLAEEISFVIHALVDDGITSVADVRITLRALNEDDQEYYPADADGNNDMGFTLSRRAPDDDNVVNARKLTWELPSTKRGPVQLGRSRGLRALLGEAGGADE